MIRRLLGLLSSAGTLVAAKGAEWFGRAFTWLDKAITIHDMPEGLSRLFKAAGLEDVSVTVGDAAAFVAAIAALIAFWPELTGLPKKVGVYLSHRHRGNHADNETAICLNQSRPALRPKPPLSELPLAGDIPAPDPEPLPSSAFLTDPVEMRLKESIYKFVIYHLQPTLQIQIAARDSLLNQLLHLISDTSLAWSKIKEFKTKWSHEPRIINLVNLA
jgi:hypothetical protein